MKMISLTEEQLKKVQEMILRQLVDGRIPCGKARSRAKSLNVPLQSVGKIADDLHIKISKCELGCF
jgi:LAO/AO transport system kinase